jgi:hypothetical protein
MSSPESGGRHRPTLCYKWNRQSLCGHTENKNLAPEVQYVRPMLHARTLANTRYFAARNCVSGLMAEASQALVQVLCIQYRLFDEAVLQRPELS